MIERKKKYCSKCYYSSGTHAGNRALSTITCDYILITGHRRPCKGGEECVRTGTFKDKKGKKYTKFGKVDDI